MFRIGQKVVCVNDEIISELDKARGFNWLPGCKPVRGAVYTVRATKACCDGAPGVLLDEIQNRYLRKGITYKDAPYASIRFRPVIERKTETGMAILREILERESFEDRKPARAQ